MTDEHEPPPRTLKLVVLGQTGAGKSSLLNYVFGTQFPTGPGRPCTPRGFHKAEAVSGHLHLQVWDSAGAEPGNFGAWKADFQDEVEAQWLRPLSDWFHVVLWVIDANSSRMEPAEISCMQWLAAKGYPVIICINKAEGHIPGALRALEDALPAGHPVIRCTSVSIQPWGSPTPYPQRGADDVRDAVAESLDRLVARIPCAYECQLAKDWATWRDGVKADPAVQRRWEDPYHFNEALEAVETKFRAFRDSQAVRILALRPTFLDDYQLAKELAGEVLASNFPVPLDRPVSLPELALPRRRWEYIEALLARNGRVLVERKQQSLDRALDRLERAWHTVVQELVTHIARSFGVPYDPKECDAAQWRAPADGSDSVLARAVREALAG